MSRLLLVLALCAPLDAGCSQFSAAGAIQPLTAALVASTVFGGNIFAAAAPGNNQHKADASSIGKGGKTAKRATSAKMGKTSKGGKVPGKSAKGKGAKGGKGTARSLFGNELAREVGRYPDDYGNEGKVGKDGKDGKDGKGGKGGRQPGNAGKGSSATPAGLMRSEALVAAGTAENPGGEQRQQQPNGGNDSQGPPSSNNDWEDIGHGYRCLHDATIDGTAGVMLSTGKASGSGYTRIRCLHECDLSSECRSFIFTNIDGYCRLCARMSGTAALPGTTVCSSGAAAGSMPPAHASGAAAGSMPPAHGCASSQCMCTATNGAGSKSCGDHLDQACDADECWSRADCPGNGYECAQYVEAAVILDNSGAVVKRQGSVLELPEEETTAVPATTRVPAITTTDYAARYAAYREALRRQERMRIEDEARLYREALRRNTAAPVTNQPITASAATTANAVTPVEQGETSSSTAGPTSSSSTAVPTSSSSTAAPIVEDEVMEQVEHSSSTAAPAAADPTSSSTVEPMMVTKDMEAEVGDDLILLESKEVGRSECGFSLYEITDEVSTEWGGAFACSGEPMVAHFPVDVSVGFTEQECAVVTGLPQHDSVDQKGGHDQDLYLTLHANCRSSRDVVQKWRMCSWRPDPSSVLCRALGMPCCTYVSNMVADNVQESCADYVPSQCNIIVGFDGVTTKQYGMQMHDCKGDPPYNPTCSIQAGEHKASASDGHSSASKVASMNVLAGVALIAIGVALRLRRRHYAGASAGLTPDEVGETGYLLEAHKLESPLRVYGSLLGNHRLTAKQPLAMKTDLSALTASKLVFKEYD